MAAIELQLALAQVHKSYTLAFSNKKGGLAQAARSVINRNYRFEVTANQTADCLRLLRLVALHCSCFPCSLAKSETAEQNGGHESDHC